VVMLVGGLAAIAVTNSTLNSTQGFRGREVGDACAQAALAQIRAKWPDATSANAVNTTYQISNGPAVTLKAGHYADTGVDPVVVLTSAQVDMSGLLAGTALTNQRRGAGGSTNSVHVVSASAICSGPNIPTREMQLIFRFGFPGVN